MFENLKQKQIHRWGPAYLRRVIEGRREAQTAVGTRHLLFAFCDHWEPLFAGANDQQGDARVKAWSDGYPTLANGFRDADGRAPQHSFFFPGEHYRPRWLDSLANLARRGFGEVELHLHHDGDTRESLAADIQQYVAEIASHGHMSRDAEGRPRFAFIHGNWCLANARADGRWCGVDDEIALLHELGCYADFTFPAPDNESQPSIVNTLFWPTGDVAQRRAYEHAERARVGYRPTDRMLFVTGPSGFFRQGKRLRIEASAITANDPASSERVSHWADLGATIAGRPEWVFVKMHTHGAPDAQAASLLGEAGAKMHQLLARHYNDGERWKLHYVTAREMFNVAAAAMDGKTGDPNEVRDYVLQKPPIAT